jgi:hypothetical protein
LVRLQGHLEVVILRKNGQPSLLRPKRALTEMYQIRASVIESHEAEANECRKDAGEYAYESLFLLMEDANSGSQATDDQNIKSKHGETLFRMVFEPRPRVI